MRGSLDYENDSLLHGRTSSTPPKNVPLPNNTAKPSLKIGEMGQRTKESSPCNKDRTNTNKKTKRRIYWTTPVSAALLFLLGLGSAIGHCVFFGMMENKRVGDQTWIFRYSLALSFVFKSALAASISIALAQQVWMALRRSKKGTCIQTIDAMFASGHSLSEFLSPSLWISAFTTALMATCIWLMPLTALVAPSALTVGSAVDKTNRSCTVPTLDWPMTDPLDGTRDNRRSLFTVDYTSTYSSPSMDSKRLVDSVLENGRQIGWPSPCGANCTYSVVFIGPSWQCTESEYVNDPRAPWVRNGTWSWYSDPKHPNGTEIITSATELFYTHIYAAGLNATTNQFWAGVATGFARGLEPWNGYLNRSAADILGVRAFTCRVARSRYNLNVTYENSIQTNTMIESVQTLSLFEIPDYLWEGFPSNPGSPDVQENRPMDVVGLYSPMNELLSGSLTVDPRSSFNAFTSLGLVPGLITQLSNPLSYGYEAPFVPRPDFGSLLEELSQNLTISLMSNSQLGVTSSAEVLCHRSVDQTVWKVSWLPVLVAYGTGLAAAIVCLLVGGFALAVNGMAHDGSFSSILRTTRSERLGHFVPSGDAGSLPLDKHIGRRRLRFVDNRLTGTVVQNDSRKEFGFTL